MDTRHQISSSFMSLRPASLGAASVLALLGLGLFSSGGCSSGGSGGTGGTGTTATTTTTATTSTTGTGGAGGSCDAAMCDDKNPCTDDVCTAGVCSNPANDDLMPSDGNPCTVDTCKDGVASHANAAAGTSCAANQVCNDSGLCLCNKDFQCGAPMGCITPTCDPVLGCVMKGCDEAAGESCYENTVCVSCTNAKKDGSETDVDCGGSCMSKCAIGKACNVDTDCANLTCVGGICSK